MTHISESLEQKQSYICIMQEITSTQNTLIKKIIQLQEKSRLRKKEGLFVIEGKREIELAIAGGYELDTLLIYEDLYQSDIPVSENIRHIKIGKEVFQKLAYRSSTEGIIAIAKSKSSAIASMQFNTAHPLVLVAEAPEKPGNIGALLRTADAANVDAIIIANPKTDLYNPNIIRSSVGCVFTNTIGVGSTSEIIDFLKEHQISIYAATLQNSNAYHLENYKEATAIVVGTEAEGLSEAWRNAARKNIIIPMQGAIDSMNVSVAAGILIFEAKRQRGFE